MESYGIGELSLSAERVNKETAAVLIVEFLDESWRQEVN